MKLIAAVFLFCGLVGLGKADTFIYDASGRLTSVEQSNGLNHSYGYDGEANLESATSSGASGGSTNGIPDWWENFYFNATGISALASAVGDGVSNLTKYAMGLNPLTSISSALVSTTQQLYTDGHTYNYYSFVRAKANASLVYLEQSSDQVMWQSGSGYFALVETVDLGDGTERVKYRNLTPIPAANSLSIRLTTNGGNSSLLAYNNVSSGSPVPSMTWWVLVILVVALPLLASRFMSRGKSIAALLALSSALMASAHAEDRMGAGWYPLRSVSVPTPVEPGSSVQGQAPNEQSINGLGDIQPFALVAGPAAAAVTPELQAIATGLNNDPLAIFNYVRNKITYQPYHGSAKGAHTTYLDAAGNDMDQASLLIALLNAAGYTNTSYVYGKISMRDISPDGRDLSHWLVVPTSRAIQILANSGVPVLSGVNGPGYVTWTFAHVWVRVVIGGTTYEIDPSFKSSELFAGIDYRTISGYSRSQLLTDAAGTVGTDYVQSMSRPGVENRLAQYAASLKNYIKTNLPNATTEEIIGGGKIKEETHAGLGAAAASLASFSPDPDKTVFTTIPSQYQATFRVRVGTQIDASFTVDSLQSRKLSLVFSGANAQLWLGDTMVAEETNGSGTTVSMILSIAYNGISQTLPTDNKSRAGSYALAYGLYPNPNSNGQIDASDARLQSYLASGLTDTNREVVTESLHGLGVKWIRRVALETRMIGQTNDSYPWVSHIIGHTGQDTGYYVDMPGCLIAMFNAGGINFPAYNAATFALSAMEHGVIEQNGGSIALSTIKCLAIANDGGQKIFRATSSNFSSITPQLTNYISTDTSKIAGYLAPAGTIALLHQNGKTGANQWLGYGFAAINSNGVSMIISGNLSGGKNSTTDPVKGSNIEIVKANSPEVGIPVGVPQTLSSEPVDLATGAYTMAATDLTLGDNETPRGLNFSRSYDSSRNFQRTSLGNGWRHSCDGKVFLGSDLDAAFGLRRPTDAVQTIAASIAISDFTSSTLSAKELMIGVLTANWMVNRITNNAASVQLGEQRLTYLSQPDGSWNPPPGTTTALTGTSGSFVLSPRFGGSVVFDAQNRISLWKDVDNNTQTSAYDSNGRLLTVTDSQGRVLTFAYQSPTSTLLQSVSDGTGRSATYTYTSNNLTGIQDVDGYNTTLVYDGRNRLTDWKDHAGAYATRNTYDAQDRVSEQRSQGASNKLWRFLYSPGVTQEIDPLGNATTHVFDIKFREVQRIDAAGNASFVNYDGQNHVVKTVDPTGRQSSFVYDGNQNLAQAIDNAGKTTINTYDGFLRLWKITDATGRITEFGYDSENHPTSTKDPGGRTTITGYRADGRIQQITDPDGKVTLFTAYDQWANPTGVTRADGSTTSAAFNVRGDLTSSTDGRAKTTSYGYNKRRLLTSKTDPLGRVSSWTYDSNGRTATATDRNGKVTTSVFDNLGKQTSLTLPDTGAVIMGYDLSDRLSTVTDGLGHTTTTGYDAASRKNSVTDALTIVVSRTEYDGAGRVSVKKNGLNQSTQSFFDSVGRLSYTLDPLGRRIDHTYDFSGRDETLTNRRGKIFSYGYGTDGLETTFTYPSGRQSRIVARDPIGRASTLQEPSGQQTVLTFDGVGRVKTQADGLGTIVWTYDGEGNPTDVAQGSSHIGRGFDDVGRLSSCTDSSHNTVGYTYDNEGNVQTITYPGNKVVTYTYDGANRLKTVTDWAGRLTVYTYDGAGRLTRVDRPNGTHQRLIYDNANRLTDTFEEKGSTVLWKANYIHNNAYRLTDYTPTPITKTYAPPPATMTYDDDNRLATYNGQSVSSDLDGNLLSAPVNGTILDSLSWDVRNRLTGAGGVTYVHDSENRRVSSTLNGQTTMYIWSRGASQDRLLVKTNSDGSITRYVYGLGLVYEESTPAPASGLTATTTIFYHYNWQGSTVALTDASGGVTGRISYSPYGERTVEEGNVETPFCFNGQFGVMTEANGLLCMKARFYSPIFRRFLSADPSGFAGGVNLYAYTGGDPVNLMDPFGLDPQLSGFQQGIVNVFKFIAGLLSPFKALMINPSGYESGGGSWKSLADRNVDSFNPTSAVVNDDLSINYYGAGATITGLVGGMVLEGQTLFSTGRTIGLGLDVDLANLRGTGALSYKDAGWQRAGLTTVDWGRASVDPTWFRMSFKEAVQNADSVRFDVSNFSLNYSKPGMTNFELNHLLNNPSLLEKTTFFQNGKPVIWNGSKFVAP